MPGSLALPSSLRCWHSAGPTHCWSQYFGKAYVNLALGGLILFQAGICVSELLRPAALRVCPEWMVRSSWTLRLTYTEVAAERMTQDEARKGGDAQDADAGAGAHTGEAGEEAPASSTLESFAADVDYVDVVCLVLAACVVAWYAFTKVSSGRRRGRGRYAC